MAFLEPFIDGREALAAAKQFPFSDERRHFPAHRQHMERRYRAVMAFVYLALNGGLPLEHVSSQAADFAPSFIDTVVYGGLRIAEEYKNKT
jgi:hypothetical protein